MTVPTITIDIDRRCEECRKGGATDNKLCLNCTSKAISGRPMKSEIGRRVQLRVRQQFLDKALADAKAVKPENLTETRKGKR